MRRVLSIVSALLLCLVANTSRAGPLYFTVFFSGTTTNVFYDSMGSSDPSSAGDPLSGWFTFQIDNAQTVDIQSTYAQARSISGCGSLVDGVCNSSPVFDADRVVVDYRITTSLGTFSPFDEDPKYFEESLRNNTSRGPGGSYPGGYEAYAAVLRQQVSERSTDSSGTYHYLEQSRTFQFFAQSFGDALLLEPVSDFFQLPNVAAINTAAAGESISLRNQVMTRASRECPTCGESVYSPDSFHLTASLDAVFGRPGRFQVPEPGTVPLVGIGIGALVMSARRRRDAV